MRRVHTSRVALPGVAALVSVHRRVLSTFNRVIPSALPHFTMLARLSSKPIEVQGVGLHQAYKMADHHLELLKIDV